MRVRQSLGLLVLGSIGVSFAADLEKPPPLVKDTLPAQLVLDKVPEGLDAKRSIPADNPLNDAKVKLGRKLFFDPLLSADRSIACASCHDPNHGFANPQPRAVGIGGKKGTRNAPSLLNRAYGLSFFWDGRTASLEEQALGPIENPLEMGHAVKEVVRSLQADNDYVKLFQEAFGEKPTDKNLAKAIASFERTLLLGNTKIDRFIRGDVAPLTPSERHGLWIFDSAGKCWKCHSGPNYTDEQFHNTGVSWAREPLDLGRYEVTKRDADRGKFKTPTLRGIALTAPYMHNGSLATLEDVVEFYNKGGTHNPHLDPAIGPLNLSKEDVQDLVNLLKALSAEVKESPK